MTIDDLIRLALTDLAEETPPAPADPAPLAIRRAVRRRRTATLLVGVACLIAAVLLGVQLASAGTDRPQPATPPTLPAPAPTNTPQPSDSGMPQSSDSAAGSSAPDSGSPTG
jgi:negative regulator of sigma E activity